VFGRFPDVIGAGLSAVSAAQDATAIPYGVPYGIFARLQKPLGKLYAPAFCLLP